jgi:hypothetical protein
VVVVAVDLVVDVLVPWLLPLLHPAVRRQMLATASAAVSWRTCSSPFPAVTTNRSARVLEVVPVFVEFEVAVPHLSPAGW